MNNSTVQLVCKTRSGQLIYSNGHVEGSVKQALEDLKLDKNNPNEEIRETVCALAELILMHQIYFPFI